MISKTGIHALAAMTKLATLKPGEFAGAADIANEIGAPKNYLGKLLKSLAGNGMLISQKGFNGGFRLAKDADDISLFPQAAIGSEDGNIGNQMRPVFANHSA